MTTHKVSELTGALLDAAVAKADRKLFEILPNEWGEPATYLVLMVCLPEFQLPVVGDKVKFCPSSQWHIGGPIIERERIAIVCSRPRRDTNSGEHWDAYSDGDYVGPDGQVDSRRKRGENCGEGPTPLIAAMRAFVASKFGDTVELP